MFFINEKVDFLIFDCDYLDDPTAAITPFLGGPYHIQLISTRPRKSLEEWLYSKHPKTQSLIIETDLSADAELEYWLSGREFLFHDVFITGNNQRILIANSKAIGTILIKNNPDFEDTRTGADWVGSAETLHYLVRYSFLVGNAGEFFMDGARSLLPGAGPGNVGALRYMKFVPNFGEYETAYSLGRFFNSQDVFLNTHLYSRFIKNFKEHPTVHKDKVNALLRTALNFIISQNKIDSYYLTYVPKKPSDRIDRNQIALENLKKDAGIEYQTLLECPTDYPTQKYAGSFAKRRNNVRGKYTTPYKYKRDTVILFDDVYTSGATLAECASVLKNAGVGKVISLSLCLVCDSTDSPLLALSCPNCHGPLKIWFNKNTAKPFWGCIESTACKKYSMEYAQGVLALRALRTNAEASIF